MHNTNAGICAPLKVMTTDNRGLSPIISCLHGVDANISPFSHHLHSLDYKITSNVSAWSSRLINQMNTLRRIIMENILYTTIATYFVSRLAILAGAAYLVYMALKPKLAFSRARG